MYDIHSHILPGIDDGSENMEEAVCIARKACAGGVKAIVGTPHVLNAPSYRFCKTIIETTTELNHRLADEQVDIKVLSGAEFFVSPDLPGYIQDFPELTINKANRHILVEFPSEGIPRFVQQIFFELLVRGITPIIAHPERCLAIQKKPKLLMNYIENGCLIQINAGSLIGKYGKKALKTSKLLLAKGLTHIVASDSHSCNGEYLLSRGMAEVVDIVGFTNTQKMFVTTPSRILGYS